MLTEIIDIAELKVIWFGILQLSVWVRISFHLKM